MGMLRYSEMASLIFQLKEFFALFVNLQYFTLRLQLFYLKELNITNMFGFNIHIVLLFGHGEITVTLLILTV